MNGIEKLKYEFYKGESAIRQIIFLCVGVFVFSLSIQIFARLLQFDAHSVLQYFYLPSNLAKLVTRPWTLITHVFFHAGFWHLLSNLLIFYYIGVILQDFVGRIKLWQIFGGGAMLGGLLFVLASNIFPTFKDVVGRAELLGASGGVTAVIVAAGVLLPNYQIRPFNLFDVSLKWVALVLVFMDLAYMPDSANLGGLFAHLGGAIFGFVYIKNIQGKPLISRPVAAKPKAKEMAVVSGYASLNDVPEKPNQEEIDAILDKISQSGYDSLTKKEKLTLFKASET